MTLSIAPAAASSPQQTLQLNQLVSQYKIDVTHDEGAQVLASLARQITIISNTVGQHVTLPKENSGIAVTAAAPVTAGGGLDLTA